MSFPADFPNPDQENVYYSLPSLKTELLNWFEVDKISTILAIYEDYYLPTFVFDIAGAPEIYNLDVWPKGKPKESIQLDSSGSIVDKVIIPEHPITPSPAKNLNDGAFNCTLDPKFYVDSILKEPNDDQVPIDTSQPTAEIDLILATKWFRDRTLPEKIANFEIIKNLLKAQLKILPEEEFDAIQKKYTETIDLIKIFTGTLADIDAGQKRSIQALKFDEFFGAIYETSLPLADVKKFGTVGTQTIIAQALSDLGNIYVAKGKNQRVAVNRNDLDNAAAVANYQDLSTAEIGYTLWPRFLDGVTQLGKWSRTVDTDAPIEALTFEDMGKGDYQRVSQFDSKDVFSDGGKINDWYYKNLQKKLLGEECDWTELESYKNGIKTTVSKYQHKATLELLGGSNLLVDQAIYKAILKLCNQSLDVYDYAPQTADGVNFFTLIGRSPSLGPSGTTPWPSKYVTDPTAYKVNPYTNRAFLSYHALIEVINKLANGSSYDFLNENIGDPDSNHDDVINLVVNLHDHSPDVLDFFEEPKKITYSSAGYGVRAAAISNLAADTSSVQPSYQKRSLTQLMHLFRTNEEFTSNYDILLIPKESDVPLTERTFIGWNIPQSDHTTEASVKADGLDASQYLLLDDEEPRCVNSSGKLNATALPDRYIDIGYIQQSSQSDALINNPLQGKRTTSANYGIGKPGKGGSKNILAFYKQRQYSMPYLWASVTSLWRGLTLETWKALIKSLQNIDGSEIDISDEEILENFQHVELWERIRVVFRELREASSLSFDSFVSPDGTLSLTESSGVSFNFKEDIRNTNTPGVSTRVMLQEFVKFVSLVSKYDSVQLVESHTPVDFDVENYLPVEGIADKFNTNFANNHGGGSQYIEPKFDPYFDKLEISRDEFQKREVIKKRDMPISGNPFKGFLDRYATFLFYSQGMYHHLQMFEHIINSLDEVKEFVNGYSMAKEISEILASGKINLERDLNDPSALIDQIETRLVSYEADEYGIGGRWNWTLDSDALNTSAENEEWLYIHVLGLKKNLMTGQYTVVPNFISGNSSVELDTASFSIIEGHIEGEQTSKNLLYWLNLSRGLDISELSFSEGTDMIYSELLIDSESGVFPWESSDFEEGVPKKHLETLYNMSPWLFPENMFNDICFENEYEKVIACAISREDLRNANIEGEIIDNRIDDVIGSIRWEVR